jgi:hypothetical protein
VSGRPLSQLNPLNPLSQPPGRPPQLLEFFPYEGCAYRVNNLADPFYHNGWSRYAALDDGEKPIIIRSSDIAPICESFWKDRGWRVNNFVWAFLGTAIVRSLSVSKCVALTL